MLVFVHVKNLIQKESFICSCGMSERETTQSCRVIGIGFDEASIFSKKKVGVQTRIKKITLHALFVHCHCHGMCPG